MKIDMITTVEKIMVDMMIMLMEMVIMIME